ncbi:amidase [Nocardia seriolae]|uniref:amidase n=1 Tax=Nocardia seriolae TaxID=37332 RepID=A0A0B8NB98_9NOCA|nr:amidase [Nocardia seriolae]APA98245.1 Amidase [Nocardia seriolae]MTJ62923.1 amidase [Nocardia seriolae]MTJ73863.1 amidase [Nocardia seriolae]MTJ87953.1 amidase [Nocardia seriolae]MTK31943.1 amidase [Nocardia seriolae]
MTVRVHAFTEDALGDHDGVAIAELIRRGELSAAEVAEAARQRAAKVNPELNAIVAQPDTPQVSADRDALLFGVPTYVKDNTDLSGVPTQHGSAAWRARPAKADGPYTKQFRASGMTVLGKTTLPEFGLNATTEFAGAEPTRNPWDTGFSSGASSGGSAALVAAGVVPIAHGNDGGGSIRIPAACCGLVGLKPTRGRHIDGPQARSMPINLVSEGVLTRSVRDTATYFAAAERFWRNPALPPVGLVEGPAQRKLRIGVLAEPITGAPLDPHVRAVLDDTVKLLESLGHEVRPIAYPVAPGFAEDFATYWAMLAFLLGLTGKLTLDPAFDASQLDPFTRGLAARFRGAPLRAPAVLYRLWRIRRAYAESFRDVELVVSPVLASVTPRLGYLSPDQPFGEVFDRLLSYVTYTPLANVTGAPALSLPLGASPEGLPVGMLFSAAHGDERTLLELAYTLEAARPFRRIQDA